MRPAPEWNGSGDAFRALPSVDELLREPALTAGAWPRPLAVEAVRAALAAARAEIARGEPAPGRPALIERVLGDLRRRSRRSLRPVINATGVILHTNLGRAPISEAAARAMTEISLGYSNLEFDLASGERGSRQSHLRELLREVTGAEDGFVVNNNAGAVLLVLSALASGREVIVSRGQAVEIGGGFRIPDVMRQSGATLVEVGTTNRTYISDYEAAVTPRTALLLRVHPSNFRLEGFVHQVGLDELVELGRRLGIPVMDDLGSGALIDPRSFGLGAEPLVQESVRAGAAVVCFSGDKLLGGPQAGIIVGKRELIEVIRRHPLARAVRIDKASIAGLEVTLRHYQRGEALEAIPVWRMIACPVDRLIERARTIEAAIGSPRVQAAPMRAAVGGGSLPGQTLPSHGVVVQPGPAGSGDPAVILARRLREHDPPIIGRIEHDALWLDLRTVEPDRDAELVAALRDLIC
ncbi:MAG: L-seryl-tRNA(Sec) selenium transferase [Chloroflexi bacterium]|nr:L-seryl-tRNA(Sec) selenium transferase [Chloroflexota bacterium]